MNLAANMVYFQTNLVNGIVLVFYLISTQGAPACGFISFTTSTTEYLAIIVQSLNRAISRYLTVYPKEDYSVANSSYSKTIFITFYHMSSSGVMYHDNDLKVTVPDAENCTSPLYTVHRVVQISSSGVA